MDIATSLASLALSEATSNKTITPTTCDTTTSAAQTATFSTYELLESILVEVPLLDLLSAVQTCRAWREVFLSSKRIRRRLFERDLYDYESCGKSQMPMPCSIADVQADGRLDDLDHISVNRGPHTPWVFRTKLGLDNGAVLLIQRGVNHSIIQAPVDPKQDLQLNGIRIVAREEQSLEFSWRRLRILWQWRDGGRAAKMRFYGGDQGWDARWDHDRLVRYCCTLMGIRE